MKHPDYEIDCLLDMINWTILKSGLVSGIIMAVLGIAGYVISIGDVFALDFRTLVNVGVMALLTALVSFIKSALTTKEGKVAGIKVK